jgi:hypothetical protein
VRKQKEGRGRKGEEGGMKKMKHETLQNYCCCYSPYAPLVHIIKSIAKLRHGRAADPWRPID